MFHRMKGSYIHSDTLILQHNLVAKTYNVLSSASLQSLYQIAARCSFDEIIIDEPMLTFDGCGC